MGVLKAMKVKFRSGWFENGCRKNNCAHSPREHVSKRVQHQVHSWFENGCKNESELETQVTYKHFRNDTVVRLVPRISSCQVPPLPREGSFTVGNLNS